MDLDTKFLSTEFLAPSPSRVCGSLWSDLLYYRSGDEYAPGDRIFIQHPTEQKSFFLELCQGKSVVTVLPIEKASCHGLCKLYRIDGGLQDEVIALHGSLRLKYRHYISHPEFTAPMENFV